jgi:hypothetical protein
MQMPKNLEVTALIIRQISHSMRDAFFGNDPVPFRLWALVNMIMNLWVPHNTGNVLTG